MTLPTELIFPLNEDRLKSRDPLAIGEYVQELVTTLSNMYRDLAQNVDGDYRQFVPKIIGSTIEGIGTYTYQEGWYLRQGLMVDVWFTIQWSAHTGTGDAYVNLPYKVKNVLTTPFVNGVFGTYPLSAGYTCMFGSAESNTFNYFLYENGPGLTVQSLNVVGNGTVIGHIRYIGQQIEN